MVQEVAEERPGRWASSAGWSLRAAPPYLLIGAVVAADWLTPREGFTGAFLVLAPLLAAWLLTGLYLDTGGDEQLGGRLVLILLGTLLAMLSQGTHRRELSTFRRAADTITIAASLAAGLEPEEAYQMLAPSARTLYDAAAVAVYRREGNRQ